MDSVRMINQLIKPGSEKTQKIAIEFLCGGPLPSFAELQDRIFKANMEGFKKKLLDSFLDYDEEEFAKSREYFLHVLISLFEGRIEEIEKDIQRRRYNPQNEKYIFKMGQIQALKESIKTLGLFDCKL